MEASLRTSWVITCSILIVALTSCATDYKLVDTSVAESVRNETFQFRNWVSKSEQPEVVVIALHGFCGAAIDYENLGQFIEREHPRAAVYAYEVRGQGKDPKKDRRGDIENREDWSRDLLAFTHMVRAQHPQAKVVWMGESMGALIVANTYRKFAAIERQTCDGLVLSSPVVEIRQEFPTWKKELVRGISKITRKFAYRWMPLPVANRCQ